MVSECYSAETPKGAQTGRERTNEPKSASGEAEKSELCTQPFLEQSWYGQPST